LPKSSIKKHEKKIHYSLIEILHCVLTTAEPHCSIFGMRTIILLRKQSFCNDTACLGSYNFTVKIKRHWPIPDQGERKKSKNLTDALKQLAESDGELACALIHDTFLVKAP